MPFEENEQTPMKHSEAQIQSDSKKNMVRSRGNGGATVCYADSELVLSLLSDNTVIINFHICISIFGRK